MSSTDFDLFQKLKINMCGVRFSKLEDLSSSVTQRVRQLNFSRGLTGIMDFPKRLDAVTQQNGDCTEGLQHFTAHLVFYSLGIAFCAFLFRRTTSRLYSDLFGLYQCKDYCHRVTTVCTSVRTTATE
jgi:hypothetical protein